MDITQSPKNKSQQLCQEKGEWILRLKWVHNYKKSVILCGYKTHWFFFVVVVVWRPSKYSAAVYNKNSNHIYQMRESKGEKYRNLTIWVWQLRKSSLSLSNWKLVRKIRKHKIKSGCFLYFSYYHPCIYNENL